MLLAVDTSTAVSSIALFDGRVRAEHTWTSRRNHAVELLPAIDAMMERSGLRPVDLTGVAVAIGPGSFNGVRVGVTTAKTLCATLGVPIAGVSTLEVVAYPYFYGDWVVRALVDAGRGRFCTTMFERQGAEWAQTETPRVVAPADLQNEVQRPTLICGDIPPTLARDLVACGGEMVIVAGPARGLRRAGYLAELGWERLQRGQSDDPATLQAIYLPRPPLPAAGGGVSPPPY